MKKNNVKIITDSLKLSERAEEINPVLDKKKVTKIINQLKDTLRKNKELTSLSAPQIGYPFRIFCINFAGDIRAFINPLVSKSKGLTLVRESSASLPNREFIVPRNEEIIAMYQKPGGIPESNRFEGVAAQVFQHQINILDGVLISDFGLEIFSDFDEASEDERNQVLNMYLDNLKATSDMLEKEINENKDLKQMSDAIKFMSALSNNEITLEKLKKDKK